MSGNTIDRIIKERWEGRKAPSNNRFMKKGRKGKNVRRGVGSREEHEEREMRYWRKCICLYGHVGRRKEEYRLKRNGKESRSERNFIYEEMCVEVKKKKREKGKCRVRRERKRNGRMNREGVLSCVRKKRKKENRERSNRK